MKVLIVGLVAWMCWSSSVMVGASGRIFPVEAQYDEDIDVTFSVATATIDSYKAFLEELRGKVNCSRLGEYYSIYILCNESSIVGDRYLKVNVTWGADYVVTLALDKVDLNVVAYKTGINSLFFLNTAHLVPQIFTGTHPCVLPFNNSYASLGNRLHVQLGITRLKIALDLLRMNIYDEIPSSLITVFGMVPEAARFLLIENNITGQFDTDFLITPQIISYEDKWLDFSETIQEAVNYNGVFPHPVEVRDGSGKPVNITNIGQAETLTNIIKYVEISPLPPPTPSPPPPTPRTPTPSPPKMYAFAS